MKKSAGLSEPSRYRRRFVMRTMLNTMLESYVSTVLFATGAPGRGAGAAARRCRWMRDALLDPYRPELHYMRGPGPKWRATHPAKT
jgi:hypothetical protein